MKALDLKKALPGQLVRWTSYTSKYANKSYGRMTGEYKKEQGYSHYGSRSKSINLFEVQSLNINNECDAFDNEEAAPTYVSAANITEFVDEQEELTRLKKTKTTQATTRRNIALQRLKLDSLEGSSVKDDLSTLLNGLLEGFDSKLYVTQGKLYGMSHDDFIASELKGLLTIELRITGSAIWDFVELLRGNNNEV